MREGDRNGTRPGAHIIETGDGTLVGSFTRLTKVRMADFRRLQAEEQSAAEAKPKTDIRSTRVPVRSEESDLMELPALVVPVTRRKQPGRIRLPRLDRQPEDVWRRRMEEVDRPSILTVSPRPPSCPVILSAEEARTRRRIRELIRKQQAILDQRAPEADWAPLEREETLAKWRDSLIPYQKQLHSSFTRYDHAKKEWKQAEGKRWQRMTGRARKLEKVCQQLLLEFLEVLRFVVQALLYVVGLRSTPPEPVRPLLTERDRPALEVFRKQHDAEFTAMADPEKLEPWLEDRFDRLVQARQDRIRRWDKAHQPEKEQAAHEIARLRSKLENPISRAGPQATAPSSRMPAPGLG
ncbi:hypothetical protein LOC54_08990 [Acetobacter sp. AN02]|uniref:hypothetical protein n=1 Tax=Acetobacter sp. AN02 TaxID=2894186 RepID=UPI00243410D5|nr:hypothetical protein [Acetobacter sp. AN02]MDG6095237.1 hypothetical protein [Acetobacter sp. AN02]